MAMDDIPDDSSAKYQLAQVVKAGNRAKDLVKQILSFSRKEIQKKTYVQIHQIVKEVIVLLRSSIHILLQKNSARALAWASRW